jgi:WD40 repeat protein
MSRSRLKGAIGNLGFVLALLPGCLSQGGGSGSRGGDPSGGVVQGAGTADGTTVKGMGDLGSASVSYESLSYSAANGVLAIAGTGGVALFDASTGVKRSTIDPGRGYATLVAHRGDAIAASLLEDLWVMTSDGVQSQHLQIFPQVYSLALAPDQSTVVSGGIDGSVRRFQTSDGSEISPPLVPVSQDFVNQVEVSPDGQYLAAATVEGAHVWSTVDGSLASDISGSATTLAFAPDSHAIAIATDTAVEIHAVPDGHAIATYPSSVVLAYSSDGGKLALSPDGTTVVVVDTATGGTLVTLTDGSPVRAPEQPQTREVAGLSFVASDARLAVAWRSGRLSEWQVGDGTLVFSRLDSDAP